MAKRALLLDSADNCVVAIEPVMAGDEVIFEGGSLTAQSSIALGHKLAIRPVAAGAKVTKYGASIGSARVAIAKGEHIHSHNLASDYIVGFHFEAAGAATQETPPLLPLPHPIVRRHSLPAHRRVSVRHKCFNMPCLTH